MSLNSPNRIPEKYGLQIAAGLIVFFLIMKFLGLGHMTELRLLNLVILTAGIYLALKKFKETHSRTVKLFQRINYRCCYRRSGVVGIWSVSVHLYETGYGPDENHQSRMSRWVGI